MDKNGYRIYALEAAQEKKTEEWYSSISLVFMELPCQRCEV